MGSIMVPVRSARAPGIPPGAMAGRVTRRFVPCGWRIIAHWKFEESSYDGTPKEVHDESTYGHHGYGVGSIGTNAAGYDGRALEGDGDVANYVRVPCSDDTFNSHVVKGVLIHVRVKLDTIGTHTFFVSRDNGYGDRYWQLLMTGSNKLQFSLYNNSGGTHNAISTTTLTTGVWYDLWGEYDGTYISVSINGVQEAKKNIGQITMPQKGQEDVYLGVQYYRGTLYYAIDGLLDEVEILTADFTAEEKKAWQWPGRLKTKARGAYPPIEVICPGRARRVGATPPVWLPFSEPCAGVYRVAGDPTFNLHVGDGGVPDTTAPPATSGVALPLTTPLAPPPAGVKEYRALCIYKNAYGLPSLNRYTRDFLVGSDGVQDIPLPSAPTGITLKNVNNLMVELRAEYKHRDDGANAADKWAIYVTADGSDPDPDNDTPVLEDITTELHVAWLRYALGAYTGGETIKATVCAYRSGDAVQSANREIVTVVVPTVPDTPTYGTTNLGTQNVVKMAPE